MTREEAKHIVDVAFSVPQAVRRDGEDRTYHEDEIREAKNMAIQALSQEPCDDAISRKAVNTLVDELARAISDERCHIPQRGRDTGHIMHDILDLPSVTQKSGKWIDDGFYAEGHSHKAFHCSKCGHNVLGFKEDLSKYCPNCGAKMESEEQTDAT